MKNLPLMLIGFRFLLAPIILILAYWGRQEAKSIIIILMYLGLISDIFDGIIARNMGVSDSKLRRLDSQTDMIFWMSIGVATYLIFPQLILSHWHYILPIFIMEGCCYAISILKFGKETCTHAFLSKMWGLSLLACFTSLLGFNYVGFPFYMAIFLGLISHIDRLIITMLLPAWTHDIPSSYHAYLIKKGIEFKKYKLFN
jgi:CDP-diacylglycerol--glycerol-3-phosphate 3-phosphatidyltransferase